MREVKAEDEDGMLPRESGSAAVQHVQVGASSIHAMHTHGAETAMPNRAYPHQHHDQHQRAHVPLHAAVATCPMGSWGGGGNTSVGGGQQRPTWGGGFKAAENEGRVGGGGSWGGGPAGRQASMVLCEGAPAEEVRAREEMRARARRTADAGSSSGYASAGPMTGPVMGGSGAPRGVELAVNHHGHYPQGHHVNAHVNMFQGGGAGNHDLHSHALHAAVSYRAGGGPGEDAFHRRGAGCGVTTVTSVGMYIGEQPGSQGINEHEAASHVRHAANEYVATTQAAMAYVARPRHLMAHTHQMSPIAAGADGGLEDGFSPVKRQRHGAI